MPSLIADLLDRLDRERRYEFEERAGTIEFDSQVPRDEAEVLALVDLLRTYPGALLGFTALEVEREGMSRIVVTTDVDAAEAHFGRILNIVDLADVVRTQFGGVALVKPLG
jgi:hypothetical protein